MKKYVKGKKGYKNVEFEPAKIKKAMKRRKGVRKVPTSVALDPELIVELKKEAAKRGIPYQIMIRMFIIDGFNKLKKAS